MTGRAAKRSRTIDSGRAAKRSRTIDDWISGGNGIFRPTVVVGGRVVATWRLVRKRLEVDAFRPLAVRPATAVERAHARLP